MKHRINKIKKIVGFRERVAMVASWLPPLGILPKPKSMPMGISINIAVQNEEDWIGPTLISLKDFADEFIIIDNGSTDRTMEIVNLVIREHGLKNVKIFQMPEANYYEVREVGLRNAGFHWFVRWDGDIVAHTSGPFTIQHLREKILGLPTNRFFVIYYPHVCLEGDLFHQLPNNELHIEDYIFTNSSDIRYPTSGRFVSPLPPIYYKRLHWKESCSFHMKSVKSAKHYLFRYYRTDWRDLGDYRQFPTLESYVTYRVNKDFDIDELTKAEKHHMIEFCKKLVPYNKQRFGEYPELIKAKLFDLKYKIIYKNGKIIGRNDAL